MIQAAIDGIAQWCDLNGMQVSHHKCAVMKILPDSTSYNFSGNTLTEVDIYNDLGVTFDRSLKFQTHIANVVKSTSRTSNMILRVFSLQSPDLYLKLYESLVVPRLSYCAHVWSPYTQQGRALLQRVQDRFLKRVCKKCNVPRSRAILPSVTEYQRNTDASILRYIIFSGKLSEYFTVMTNNRRSRCTIHPHEVARVDVVNNAFVWRVPRLVREHDLFKNIVKTLLK